MKDRLYDDNGCRIPQTVTPSPFVGIFGYSVNGCDYKKTSINIEDPLFLKGNGNYYNGEVYIINTNDAYASKIMKEDVNRVPLFWQNPDIYLKTGIGCTIVGLVLLAISAFTLFAPLLNFNMLPAIVSFVAFGISFLFVILYNVAMFFYRIQMRETARDICNYYYNLSHKKAEEKKEGTAKLSEEDLILASSKYYSTCPECGAVRFGNYSNCKLCGTSLLIPEEETA